VTAETPREFFENLPERVDRSKAAGLTASYVFEVADAGTWTVRVDDGDVTVEEGAGNADCTIATSQETFMKIVRREQNPTSAYMLGKVRVRGSFSTAMKLQKLF
jgi:putative sterol carrier protein